MGLALQEQVSRKKKTLPLLTPEYRAGIKTFTQRYFEQLFEGLTVPHAIVFDNYQDVAPFSSFHEIIQDGLSLIPKGINIIALSRNEPPPPLLGVHYAEERFSFIGWNDIRFSYSEAREFALSRFEKALDTETLTRLYGKTDGWIAGLLLMLESLKNSAIDYQLMDKLSSDKVFDYFADRIFSGSDKEIQDFLLKTSLAPEITLHMAEQLTGIRSSEQILSRLARNNFFTEKRLHTNPGYQYHPLFREFLLARAIKAFTSDKVRKIKRKAAVLLEEAGRTEAAAGLFMEAADWEALADLIVNTAPALTSEGRYKTLGGWLGRIPDDFLNKKPWLLYWKGAYLLPANPVEARKSFEAAYELFKDEDDKRGLFPTWSYIVDTFMSDWTDFQPLDHWISELELLIHRYKDFDSRQVEDLINCRMFCALMFRQPHHPELPQWKEKAERVMSDSPDKAQGLFIGYNLVIYNLWIGRVHAAHVIVDSLSPRYTSESRHSLPYLMWLRAVALYYLYDASYERALETIADGLTIAEDTGIHLLDLFFIGEGIYCATATGDVRRAEDFFRKLDPGRNCNSSCGHVFYRHMASMVYSLKGDFPLSISHAEESLRISINAGLPFLQGILYYYLAVFLIQAGKYDDVPGHIAELRKIGSASRSSLFELYALSLEASLALERQDDEKFIHYARKAFALSRETGNKTILHHGITHRIYIKALEAGIAVDYVQELIRLHNIVPDESHVYMENWPWQLKIHTLGSFELLRDDKLIAVGGKTQKKPLELLKVLISFGGENVPEERLADTLWPEADGDLAHRSFDTTLHRLRKLLGSDKALKFQASRLSLDPRHFWIDTRAFEHYCTEIENIDNNRRIKDDIVIENLSDKAAHLYKGHFLSSDMDQPWAASMRQHMRGRYIKIIGTIGKYWAWSEQWNKAAAWFQRGIEVDNLAEEFYQGLMVCHERDGRIAEAVKVYRSCRVALSDFLELAPSPKTEEIYRRITKYAIRISATTSQQLAPAISLTNKAPASKPVRLSIVVLPFTNAGGDPTQDYFSDVITDDVTTQLSKIKGSYVIGYGTALTYKGKDVDIKALGIELGVHYVLRGSVDRFEEGVDTNVQLVDSLTGAIIWADNIEVDKAGIRNIRREVVIRLATALDIQLIEAEAKRSQAENPDNPDATDLTMQGFALFYGGVDTLANLTAAQALFERALNAQATYQPALVGRARAMITKANLFPSANHNDLIKKAEADVVRAIALDSLDPQAHYVLSLVRLGQKRPEAALAEIDNTLTLDSNNVRAQAWRGMVLTFNGQPELTPALIDRALQQSPRDPLRTLWLFYKGYAYYHQDKFTDAIVWYEKSSHWLALVGLAGSYFEIGDMAKANMVKAQLLAAVPSFKASHLTKYFTYSDNPEFVRRVKRLQECLIKLGVPE